MQKGARPGSQCRRTHRHAKGKGTLRACISQWREGGREQFLTEGEAACSEGIDGARQRGRQLHTVSCQK